MTKRIDYTVHGFENVNITNPETVKKLEAALDMPIQSTKELVGGVLNKVFHVRGEEKDLVIKVSPAWSLDSLKRERWCYQQIRQSTRLRLAALFGYFEADNVIFPGHEILSMEYVPGHTVTPVEIRKRKTHQVIVRILNEFHKVRSLKGYGWLNRCFSGEHEDWHQFLKDMDNVDVVLEKKALRPEEIEWLVRELLTIVESTPETSLLFGDVKRENLIVKNENEIIPIDLQNCFVGDPLYDVGVGLFFNEEMLPFLKLYLRNGGSDLDRVKVSLYALRHAIGVLGHRLSIHDRVGAKKALDRFNKLRTLYQSLQ